MQQRMADVTKNPPLACYYAAVVGRVAGWSERAFHLGFLVPALALVLGTYRLAKHFTSLPVLAALATLLTPGSTRVGMQHHVRHDDGDAMGMGSYSLD